MAREDYAAVLTDTAGAGSPELFVTTDGGLTWIDRTGALPIPNAEGAVYIDIDTIIMVGSNLTVYRSTNNGASWTSIGALPAGGREGTLIRNPITGTLTMGHENAFPLEARWFRSTDNGVTWTTPSMAVPFADGVFSVGKGGSATVSRLTGTFLRRYDNNTPGTHGYIIRITNDGQTGTIVQTQTNLVALDHVAVHFSKNGTAWLTRSDGTIARSQDDGATWSEIQDIGAGVGGPEQHFATDEITGRVWLARKYRSDNDAAFVDSGLAALVHGGGTTSKRIWFSQNTGSVYSDDNGATWPAAPAPWSSETLRSFRSLEGAVLVPATPGVTRRAEARVIDVAGPRADKRRKDYRPFIRVY